MNTGRHEVVVHVAENAHNLRSQSFVQDLDRLRDITLVGFGYRAFLDLLARSIADFFDIGRERRHKFFLAGIGLKRSWKRKRRSRDVRLLAMSRFVDYENANSDRLQCKVHIGLNEESVCPRLS